MNRRKTVVKKNKIESKRKEIQDYPGWVYTRTARKFQKKTRAHWKRSRIFR